MPVPLSTGMHCWYRLYILTYKSNSTGIRSDLLRGIDSNQLFTALLLPLCCLYAIQPMNHNKMQFSISCQYSWRNSAKKSNAIMRYSDRKQNKIMHLQVQLSQLIRNSTLKWRQPTTGFMTKSPAGWLPRNRDPVSYTHLTLPTNREV